MQLFFQVVQRPIAIGERLEWKKLGLRIYLAWSICVDIAAFCGLLWYLLK